MDEIDTQDMIERRRRESKVSCIYCGNNDFIKGDCCQQNKCRVCGAIQ